MTRRNLTMGLHLNDAPPDATSAERFRRYVAEVRPEVVKFNAAALAPDLLAWVRDHGGRTIGRVVIDAPILGASGMRRFYREAGRKYEEYRNLLDYVELGNEQHSEPEECDRLAEQSHEFMTWCEERGFAACLTNWSVGTPRLDVWRRPAVAEMVRAAGRRGHKIGLHEYYMGEPEVGMGANGVRRDGTYDLVGRYDRPEDLGRIEGWWVCRVVQVVRIWRELGIDKRPGILITEGGRDGVPGIAGQGRGFRDERVTSWGGTYADKMVRIYRHYSAIPEVEGGVDFGCFTALPESWGSFDLNRDVSMFDEMRRKMQGLAAAPAIAAALAPPATEPPPRRPGRRHVVERGDTLWRISRLYGTTVEALVTANACAYPGVLEKPPLIHVGDVLAIPGG